MKFYAFELKFLDKNTNVISCACGLVAGTKFFDAVTHLEKEFDKGDILQITIRPLDNSNGVLLMRESTLAMAEKENRHD